MSRSALVLCAAALALLVACAVAAPPLRAQTHVERVSPAEMGARISDALNAGSVAGTLRAGVSKVDAELPVGVPLAGINHGPRRVSSWPVPKPTEYTMFMSPSVGILEPTYVRCLIIDNGVEQVVFVTVDAIGAANNLMEMAMEFAAQQHFPIGAEKVIWSASHSHSGPGAVAPDRLWELAPATDLLVPALAKELALSVAASMIEANSNMVPVAIALGMTEVYSMTRNRRGGGDSPYLKPTDIDPYVGIMRVDTLDGRPFATLWNFAIHGTCYGEDNMYVSGDVMGLASQLIENQLGGIALFVNADAGDIAPSGAACANKPSFNGSHVLADAVMTKRATLKPTTDVQFRVASQLVSFGNTNLNLTLERMGSCDKHHGELSLCGLCDMLKCDANLHLDNKWIENTPRFTAVAWTINNEHTLMVTIPGEPLTDLGKEIRSDATALGFDRTFLLGYSQAHMGYFATPREYDVGGYEALLTFWGINTAEIVRGHCRDVATQVRP